MKQLHIGITGSRDGITQAQIESYVTELSNYDEVKLHHGDCVGVDEGIHKILLDAKKENHNVIEIFIHPPTDNKQRAFCQKKYETKDVSVHSFASEEYLKRNQLALRIFTTNDDSLPDTKISENFLPISFSCFSTIRFAILS